MTTEHRCNAHEYVPELRKLVPAYTYT